MVRIRNVVAATLAAGVALVAPFRAGAANRGVAVDNGDRALGEIASGGDVDNFVANLASGGTLSGTVKAQKGSTLLPAVSLITPLGNPVGLGAALKGLGKTKVSFKNFPIGESGDWAIVVSGSSSTTGLYDASFKWKSPSKELDKGLVVPNNGTLLCPIVADDGALLTFKVTEKSGPAVALVEIVDPEGEVVEGSEELVIRKGTKVSGKKILLGSGFGTYAVRLTSAGTGATTVDCLVSVKFAKVEKETHELGPEPTITGASPNQGRDTTSVTINGTNFANGARVYFGDVEASNVQFDSATALTCPAPVTAQTNLGGQVSVSVLNPDGQDVVRANTYRYLGVPAPSSVTPSGSPLAGGVTVTINGSNFRAGSTVTVKGVAATNVQVVSSNVITCTTPAGTAGPASIVVSDEFGRPGVPVSGHSYFGPPTLTSATPNSQPSFGGQTVTLTGSGFRLSPPTTLYVDGNEVAAAVVVSTTSITFPLPAGPSGAVPITVEDEFGQSASSSALLTRVKALQVVGSSLPAASNGTDYFANSVRIGDLDGDGSPDLILTSVYPHYDIYGYPLPGTRILMNDGSGVFTDGTADRQGTFSDYRDYGQGRGLALADLTGDGYLDFVVSMNRPLYYKDPSLTYNGKTAFYWSSGPTYVASRVLVNDGQGYFANETSSRFGVPNSTSAYGQGERFQAASVAVGDLDGDGSNDLVLTAAGDVYYGYISYAYYYSYSGYYYLNESTSNRPATRILLNDGSGNFSYFSYAVPGPYYYYAGGYYGGYGIAEDFDGTCVNVGDLDDDGDVDLVVTRDSAVYYTTGSYYTGYTTYYMPATRVLRNDSYGYFSFSPGSMPAFPAFNYGGVEFWQGRTNTLGDIDGNGTMDLLVGKGYAQYWYDSASGSVKLNPALRVLSNDGYGYFYDVTYTALPSALIRTSGTEMLLGVNKLVVGDVDDDSDVDLVVGGSVYYVYNVNGTGTGYYGIVPSGYIRASRLLLNDGTGYFTDGSATLLPPGNNGDYLQCGDVAIGDLDGDGSTDLVFVSDYYPTTPTSSGVNRPTRIMLNK